MYTKKLLEFSKVLTSFLSTGMTVLQVYIIFFDCSALSFNIIEHLFL